MGYFTKLSAYLAHARDAPTATMFLAPVPRMAVTTACGRRWRKERGSSGRVGGRQRRQLLRGTAVALGGSYSSNTHRACGAPPRAAPLPHPAPQPLPATTSSPQVAVPFSRPNPHLRRPRVFFVPLSIVVLVWLVDDAEEDVWAVGVALGHHTPKPGGARGRPAAGLPRRAARRRGRGGVRAALGSCRRLAAARGPSCSCCRRLAGACQRPSRDAAERRTTARQRSRQQPAAQLTACRRWRGW